ncbi:6-pyruvoyltetrahydropterin/6-carboxytetrahydropterin synthase [Andreprevotia lacus DSM 23236]|jgi:6-pyruvoyltetrahydropterin/6-carboxytetrahydropterin synthase|uniref:6-carboxy-5,6,7,8-tetrahydropterin synthase n=1 Tax=Andreprevotia lacus DSM 23236 TaxID=1121001 RepID=A0A1W1X1R5_9NEIS|nr:6-carboxytetrahydropterin synthase [Andreprevotia lacus]SMC17837.1 6-pyruvoyltetrahydropterin/6-carboxytetrahydropterin synthase [Andreprevotia lacus DSM 23236]
MLIRKLFKFENAHIVRNCSSDRCRRSIHGHSYKVEVLLEAHALDHGQMVYDFGLMKGTIKDVIDAFDHAICFWDKDDAEYIRLCKEFSARWIALPVSPSAEQFARLFFVLIDAILKQTVMKNGEADVLLHSVIAHETDTGYAQAFRDDAYNPRMGSIALADIVFSDQVRAEWGDPQLYDKLQSGTPLVNPDVTLQVKI